MKNQIPQSKPTDSEQPSCKRLSVQRLVRRCVSHHFACDCRERSFRQALEAADECLSLIEDVGHGAHVDNVTVARKQVLAALALFPTNGIDQKRLDRGADLARIKKVEYIHKKACNCALD